MGSWEDQLWAEIDAKSDPDKFVLAGDIITRMMRDVLPALANTRRMAAVHLVETGGYTATKLAETIGARPGTIARLVEEGRRNRRRELEEK
jgi:DNA-directed RNA polymerase specialized sigma24 family protein